MTQALEQRTYTCEEYLEFETASEERHEGYMLDILGYLQRLISIVMQCVCQIWWVGRSTMRISARLMDGEEIGFTEFRQKT